MTPASFLPRKFLTFAIILPLAAFLGYLLSNPDFESLFLVGSIVGAMSIPLFLRSHHLLLILSWNLAMSFFFLPGNPPLWMMAAGISLGITILNRVMDKQKVWYGDAAVTWSLLALVFVVLLTMSLTTGLGFRALGGSTYGSRKYVFILASVLAYFALSVQPIPKEKADWYVGLFFLAGLTPVVSHVIFRLGPNMWFLYSFFQMDFAVTDAIERFGGLGGLRIGRLSGLGPAGLALCCFLFCRYGVRGLIDVSRPWRGLFLVAAVGVSLFGGFRSIIVLLAGLFVLLFCFEGLHRSRLLPSFLLGGMLLMGLSLPFAYRLPLSVQRCLTVIPFARVDPLVRVDAIGSTDWRLRMWSVLWHEVPKYLWVGRGCAEDASDYYLAAESLKRGFAEDFEMALVAGDYHSGPFSVVLPFGLPGVAAFGWFLWAATRVLYRNFRYGDPAFKRINSFLFAFFLAKMLYFLILFGSLHSDFVGFVGLVGMSISLNRGVAKPSRVPVPVVKPEPVKSLVPRLASSFRN